VSGTPDGLPQPRRFWAVFTTGLGLIMAVLTGSIANLALPTIARDLAVSPAESAIGEANTDSTDSSLSTDGSISDPASSGFSNAQATSGFNGTPASAIPEPSSLCLVGSMFIGLGLYRRKQRTTL